LAKGQYHFAEVFYLSFHASVFNFPKLGYAVNDEGDFFAELRPYFLYGIICIFRYVVK
jgi:hypothetical protein